MNEVILELLLLAVVFLMLILWGVTLYSPLLKRANKNDIDMLIEALYGENLSDWGTYIGHFDQKVYIDLQTKCQPIRFLTEKIIHTLYWIPIDELSPEVLVVLSQSDRKM